MLSPPRAPRRRRLGAGRRKNPTPARPQRAELRPAVVGGGHAGEGRRRRAASSGCSGWRPRAPPRAANIGSWYAAELSCAAGVAYSARTRRSARRTAVVLAVAAVAVVVLGVRVVGVGVGVVVAGGGVDDRRRVALGRRARRLGRPRRVAAVGVGAAFSASIWRSSSSNSARPPSSPACASPSATAHAAPPTGCSRPRAPRPPARAARARGGLRGEPLAGPPSSGRVTACRAARCARSEFARSRGGRARPWVALFPSSRLRI